MAIRASEIRPHSSKPFLCLARIRLRLGDVKGAAEFLRHVVESATKDVNRTYDLLYHRDASKESIYLFATLHAYFGDMNKASELFSLAEAHGHEIAATISEALRNGEINEIRQESIAALNTWSRQITTEVAGQRYFQSAEYKTRRTTRLYDNVGPSDLYEHVNVYVKPDGECILTDTLLEYFTKMKDTILRNCGRRVESGNFGPRTPAQVLWEIVTKPESIPSEMRQDFGYWMDHRVSYVIKIDEKTVTLKFGLTEDPIAVARVSCLLHAPDVDETDCVNAVAQAVHGEQVREQVNRVERNGGWRRVE